MAKEIRRFSQEQIDRANAVNVIDYARSQGIEVVQSSGEWYRAKHQGGLYFKRSANTWHWETQDTGGRGAISLCMKLENKSWKEAVKTLLNEEMDEMRYEPEWKPEPEQIKEFHLPEKNNTYRHVFAYLIKHRGIEDSIVKDMVARGYIYENTKNSCVFVGKDSEGNAKHASVRSTNTEGRVFKQDVAGSKKEYSFSLSGTSGIVNVCEAPIDVLSYMSLQKIHGIPVVDSYVSLGGVTDKALDRFMKEHPDIHKIRVCTDHDEAGEGALKRIYEKYGERCNVTRHRPTYKDFNEDLMCYREQELFQSKGISKESALWYQNNYQKCQVDSYENAGNTNNIFICKDKVEAMAIRDLRYEAWKADIRTRGLDDGNAVVARDNYMVCSQNADALLKRLQNVPENMNIYVCAAEQDVMLRGVVKTNPQRYQLCTPNSESFQSDLAISNAAEQALVQAQTMEADMEVGMEM